MKDPVNRMIHFYRIRFWKNNTEVNPESVFDYIGSLPPGRNDNISIYEHIISGLLRLKPPAANGHYFLKEDGDIWSMEIDWSSIPVKAKMGTIRKKGLPLLWKSGKVSPLEVKVDEGLYEPMHFMIFAENAANSSYYVAGFEYNLYGPKPLNIVRYIERIASPVVDEVELIALMRKDVQEQLDQIGEIRVLELRVHRDTERLLQELDRSLHDALRALKRITDAECIEIVLRSRKYSKKKIGVSFVGNLANWLSRPDTREAVDSLKLRGKAIDSNATEEFDLSRQYILSRKKVVIDYGEASELASTNGMYTVADTASIVANAMYSAITDAYMELSSEINRIIRGG